MTEQKLTLIPDPEPSIWELIGLWMMGELDEFPKGGRPAGQPEDTA